MHGKVASWSWNTFRSITASVSSRWDTGRFMIRTTSGSGPETLSTVYQPTVLAVFHGLEQLEPIESRYRRMGTRSGRRMSHLDHAHFRSRLRLKPDRN